MRDKKYNQTGKESLSSRHPVRQQLLAALLGLCLIVVSIPVPQFSLSVQAAQSEPEVSEPSALSDDSVTDDDGKDNGPQNEKPVFTVYFYSGSAGNKVTRSVELGDAGSGTVIAPGLEPMEGFEAVGWSKTREGFEAEIEAGSEITLTGSAVYYGIYRKQVTLSYDANGGETCPESETKTCYANVGQKVFYDMPTFEVAGQIVRPGYVFAGWNTQKDEKGETFDAGTLTRQLDNDTKLYAIWLSGSGIPYRVEHYKQNIEDDGYTRVDADTEYLTGQTGAEVTAEANPYTGFSLSSDSTLGKTTGIIEADGSLVLQLYYDRDVYEIEFDLNGGDGIAPQKQTVRYGGLLRQVEEPQRKGYTFEGWYMDEEASETYWEPYQTVEENTESPKVTLYAKWTDQTAPILGEASFGLESNNFMDWVIGQEKLVITVPVIEKGSGLKQADYTLISENGDRKEGMAQIRTEYTLSPAAYARSGGIDAVMTVRGNAEDGEYEVVITIEEGFKGSVALTCTDTVGNTSVEKILTAVGAGVIVEDNAPDIRFSKAGAEESKSRSAIRVEVTDSAGNYATAGLAEISYRIDGGKARAVGEEELADSMVDNYSFEVDINGEGEHTLAVTAVDNAGNKSTKEATVKILKKKAVITPNTKTPTTQQHSPKSAAGEPATGENTQVKVFATLGMIAGFTYLLLYFTSGESGITEDEKEEIISRLVRWAQKGKLRKYPALIVIMLFLAYYHSIGKSVSDEWKKVCEA